MPGLNGIELCEQIKNPNIQKILLTGVADEEIALNAFNEGLIHHYIKKDGPNIFATLNKYISKCNRRYFNCYSDVYLKFLMHLGATPLTDPLFIELFNKFLEENYIVEYYLLDSFGNFLCFNKKGEASGLFLFTEEVLAHLDNQILEMAQEDLHQEILTSTLLKEFSQRQKAFRYYYFDDSPFPAVSTWGHYIYSISPLKGKLQNYYWAHVPYVKNFNHTKVLSYEKFQETLHKLGESQGKLQY